MGPSIKDVRKEGEGSLSKADVCRLGGEVKNGRIFADVLYALWTAPR